MWYALGVNAVWDKYAQDLASLAEWRAYTPAAQDILEASRIDPRARAVVGESLELIKGVWGTLPSDLRREAYSMLFDAINLMANAAGQITPAIEAASEAIPFIQAAVKGITMIVEGAQGVDRIKKDHSNYAHGAAQYETIAPIATNLDFGFYHVVECNEFAQFVKIRTGGDFDRKPAFSRAGLKRDAIFTGTPSPPDDPGNCAKEMSRGLNDSYGPFEPKHCGRRLGISALLWPWWSAAYEPEPLPRWDARYKGPVGFELGVSPDTNARLVMVQTNLVMDPVKNVRTSLESITKPASTFQAWWGTHGGKVRPMKGGKIVSGAGARIDAKENTGHVPLADAESRWYYASDGRILSYPGQPGSDTSAWGVALPSGDPVDLGCSIAQYNAVVDAVSAFSARRLATLRTPRLCEALLSDYSSEIDSGARNAMLAAAGSKDVILPYPGAFSPKRVVMGGTPPRLGGKRKASTPVIAAGAAGGLWLLSKVIR